MGKLTHDGIARRLAAVRKHLGKSPAEMAAALGVGRTTYLNWEAGSRAKKPNFPAEEAMVRLCDEAPGVTMDYLYRNVAGDMKTALLIRLTAFEMGMNPDEAGFDPGEVAPALAERLRSEMA